MKRATVGRERRGESRETYSKHSVVAPVQSLSALSPGLESAILPAETRRSA